MGLSSESYSLAKRRISVARGRNSVLSYELRGRTDFVGLVGGGCLRGTGNTENLGPEEPHEQERLTV
jgi:hypothetical protein